MRKVVYSAIMSSNYKLNEPIVKNNDWDLVCFTNNKNITSKYWTIVQMRKPPNFTNVKFARRYKCLCDYYLGHQYDLSLWLDAKFTIKQNLDTFVGNSLKDYDMVIMDHNKRHNIADESETLIEKNFANNPTVIKEIKEQMIRYAVAGYPSKRNVLLSTGILIRKHNVPQLKKVMEEWWKEILKGSQRDMLSLPYVFWKLKQKNITPSVRVINFKKTYESFMNRK